MPVEVAIIEDKIKHSAFDRFNKVLKIMAEKQASDLHISVGSGFRIRIQGKLVPLPDSGPLTPSDIASIAAGIVLASRKCTQENIQQFIKELTDFDCSYSVAGLGRYRVNIASQRRSLALVLRHIPYILPRRRNKDKHFLENGQTPILKK